MLNRLNILVSYGTLRERCIDVLRPDWDVFLDSGAFSNFKAGKELVTLDGYSQFLEKHGARFWRYISLDRIGDPDSSRLNYQTLRDRGFAPVPVFQRGAPLQAFEELADSNDLIAIGGIAGALKRSASDLYVSNMMQYSRALGVNVHLLGIGSLATLSANRPYSADSSDYTYCNRFGSVNLWNARSRQFQAVGSRDPLTRPLVQLLASYGVTPENIRDRRWWGANPRWKGVLRASILSMFRYTEHLSRLGVRYFLATGTAELEPLTVVWNEYRAQHDQPTPPLHSTA